jgi:hypothetical protein
MTNTLVWVEHEGGAVKDATLHTVTAAAQIGTVTALVAGQGVDAVAAAARRLRALPRCWWPMTPPMPMPCPKTSRRWWWA